MINIAIDGPAGAGKSTIAKAVAKDLGIIYLDTGAMYRATAYLALQKGIDPKDEQKVSEMLEDLKMDIVYKDGEQRIIVNGIDATPYLREHYMSKAASDISALPCVRYKMVDLQRNFASKNDVTAMETTSGFEPPKKSAPSFSPRRKNTLAFTERENIKRSVANRGKTRRTRSREVTGAAPSRRTSKKKPSKPPASTVKLAFKKIIGINTTQAIAKKTAISTDAAVAIHLKALKTAFVFSVFICFHSF